MSRPAPAAHTPAAVPAAAAGAGAPGPVEAAGGAGAPAGSPGDDALAALAHGLPKAELHVHAEACLEPELLLRIADRNGIALPYRSVEQVRAAYEGLDFTAFLEVYYRHLAVLRTEQDFQELVEAYLERAHAQGVRHVELFFDPQAHVRRGVPLATAVDGLLAGLRDGGRRVGVTGGLIACFIRELGPEAAERMLGELERLPSFDQLIGVGLDSVEEGWPPPVFERLYARAASNGLRRVVHAAETGPGENAGLALRVLDAERIDAGIRCEDDPASLAELVRRGTPLTVCPLANVRAGLYPALADHPVGRLIRAGLAVTINSGGPACVGAYVADNWVAVQRAFGLGAGDLIALARRSVDASFTTATRRAELHAAIDAHLAALSPT